MMSGIFVSSGNTATLSAKSCSNCQLAFWNPMKSRLPGAQRAIREEIGMAANKLNLIGEFFLAPGYSSEKMYVYLAENLVPDPLPKDEDELIRVERITIHDAYRRIRFNQIEDAKSISALMLALPYVSDEDGIRFSILD